MKRTNDNKDEEETKNLTTDNKSLSSSNQLTNQSKIYLIYQAPTTNI